jgi:RNA polymerase sigma factor (TIGR02999 family)
MNDVTEVLDAIGRGDAGAAGRLLPLVYDELRRLAAQKLDHEKPGQTLQPTALVHEAYLRLVGGGPGPDWNSRGHFFAAAAEAMRRILIENARRKGRLRHGGGRRRVELEKVDLPAEAAADDLLALDEALQRLAAEEPAAAEVVKLRYFAGLTIEQAAAALGLHTPAADGARKGKRFSGEGSCRGQATSDRQGGLRPRPGDRIRRRAAGLPR